MTKKQSLETREKRRISAAFVATSNEASRREAARIARIPLSTFQYRWNNKDTEPATQRTFLTPQEEDNIVQLLACYANRGYLLYRDDLCDAVENAGEHHADGTP